MADEQTLSPSTVDAFASAPQDKQRDALSKMSVPAKTALLAALKTRNQTPAPSPAPAANPLVTDGEGQYQMKGKDGKPTPVSYGHVLDAIKNGYNFVDRPTLAKFAHDHAADPNNVEHKDDAAMKAMSNWNPVKYLEAIGAGVTDVAQGAGGEGLKVLTGFDRPSTSRAETELQLGAETGVQNAVQGLGAGGEQVAELFAAPEAKIPEIAKAGKAVQIASKVVGQGARAAAEQGAQTFVHSGGDTGETKQAAEVGGVAGGLSSLLPDAVAVGKNFVGNVQRFFNKVSDIQTEQLVRSTREANQEITKSAQRIRDENAQKLFDAQDAHAEKVNKAREDYDKKVEAAKEPAARAQADNEFKAEQTRLDNEHELQKAKLEHEAAVAEQQALTAKQSNLTRSLYELRGRLATRMKTIQDAATGYFKKNYQEVEDIVNKPDEKTGEVRSVPIEELGDAVDDARKHLEGSEESIKVFNDISKKLRGVGKAEKASGLSEEELSALAPDELDAVHKAGGVPQSVGFSDLKGYYSELGRMLSSPSVPGDVKQAVVSLRSAIDEMQQKLANDAGVGARYRTLRNQYRNYAKGFLDYQGPNQSGSPVAYGLKAADAHNATKGFLNMEPEELSRTKQILAGGPDQTTQFTGDIVTPGGKTEPGWRYRRDTTKLLDNFLKTERDLSATSKKIKPVGGFEPPEPKKAPQKKIPEPKDVGEFEPPEFKAPKEKEIPEKEVLTPDKLKELKKDAVVKSAGIVNRFGVYMAAGGIIGGVTELIRTHDPVKAATGAAEGVAVGLGGGAVAPYLVARLIEKPAVVDALTKVTRGDLERLMKLPPDERQGVEELMKKLSDEAVAKGKLRAAQIPWYRILGGTIGKTAAKAATPQTQPQGESEEDIEKDLNQMQGAPQ